MFCFGRSNCGGGVSFNLRPRGHNYGEVYMQSKPSSALLHAVGIEIKDFYQLNCSHIHPFTFYTSHSTTTSTLYTLRTDQPAELYSTILEPQCSGRHPWPAHFSRWNDPHAIPANPSFCRPLVLLHSARPPPTPTT